MPGKVPVDVDRRTDQKGDQGEEIGPVLEIEDAEPQPDHEADRRGEDRQKFDLPEEPAALGGVIPMARNLAHAILRRAQRGEHGENRHERVGIAGYPHPVTAQDAGDIRGGDQRRQENQDLIAAAVYEVFTNARLLHAGCLPIWSALTF